MRKLNLKVLIASIIAGIVACILDTILYGVLVNTVSRPVLVALLMVVLAVIVSVVVIVVLAIDGTSDDEFLFLSGKGMVIIGVVVCILILGVLSGVLEMIYDRDTETSSGATSYIFILDESGSMDTNDPNYERYSAVRSVMSSMPDSFPYAVYMFSDDCYKIRDLAPVSDGMVTRPSNADQIMGLTYISEALTFVYNDITSGTMDVGAAPCVILLTDGIANDMDYFSGKAILNDYEKSGIVISTVGLGNSIDEDLMEDIAGRTGGQYINVSDASQLAQGFSTVITEARRDLVSDRNMREGNTTYAILRILFLTLIGAAFAFIKAMACANDSTMTVLIVGAAAALVGALVMEFGFAIGLPSILMWVVYWVCLAATPAIEVRRYTPLCTESTVIGWQDMSF